MKLFRVAAVLLAVVCLFTVFAAAVAFTPSIERKDGPTLVDGVDGLILTPLKDLIERPETLHEDIHKSLSDAWEELKKSTWKDLVSDFDDQWKERTEGAPVEHAVVSDIFDMRLLSELGAGNAAGQKVTFLFNLQGLTPEDVFMIIAKADGADTWHAVNYEMLPNGEIMITENTKTVFAIVRDNGEPPMVTPGAPESPQTAVSSVLWPALIGAVLFAGVAVFCVTKLANRSKA